MNSHTASQELGGSLILTVQSGSSLLRNAKSCVIKAHDDADFALIKLEFDVGEIPACGFLPIAKAIDDGEKGSGFVVSCGEVSVAGKGQILESARVLSIHQFQKKGAELESTLPGKIDEDQVEKMLEAIISFSIKNDSAIMAEIKAITINANIEFPGTAGEQKSMRLMSALRGGCSGSPLVIKQKGAFGIIGILNRGASAPKAFRQEVAVLDSETLRGVVVTNSFIDLTLYREWIEKSVLLLS